MSSYINDHPPIQKLDCRYDFPCVAWGIYLENMVFENVSIFNMNYNSELEFDMFLLLEVLIAGSVSNFEFVMLNKSPPGWSTQGFLNLKSKILFLIVLIETQPYYLEILQILH